MGRRQFRQELTAATQNPPPHIAGVRPGEDGEISFEYRYLEKGDSRVANLQLLAVNVDEYPHENEYMIYAPDGEVDAKIANALEIVAPLLRNKSIHNALTEVSICLHQAITRGQSSNPIDLSTSSEGENEEPLTQFGDDCDEAEGWLDEGDEDAAFGFEQTIMPSRPVTVGRTSNAHFAAADIRKVKADLRQAKEAGFKIGIIGDLHVSGIISVSIRVAKLGISEEVMKAWGLEASQYFVLLIRFQNGYQSLDAIKEESTLSGSTEIRLGLCHSYKPDTKSAFDTFNEISKEQEAHSQVQAHRSPTELLPLFIGRPLNELFRARFARIVKFRDVYQLGWAGAEQLTHDTQGANIDTMNMSKYDFMTDDNNTRALPRIVIDDTVTGRQLKNCSLPLVAMQFALRHFVRCTEFCLVCHCSSGSTFEALKPFVCSKPLCLYQYMGLGFGPSIEWEILSQPYVVDLLVSFCYAQVQANRLKDFPVGLDLKVPLLPQYSNTAAGSVGHAFAYNQATIPTMSASRPTPIAAFTVPYNPQTCDFLFPSSQLPNNQVLKKGDFVAVVASKVFRGTIYHRVEDVMLPSVKLAFPVHVHGHENPRDSAYPTTLPNKYFEADCYLFTHQFDELPDDFKSKSIMTLLDTLPPVKDMTEYLKSHNIGKDASLRHWRNRISPPALNVLRWIIASNRSCIMQVDTLVENRDAKSIFSTEDRVTGMDEYMQFRFAQGAPDKEQRFVDCVKNETEGSQYPTLFAWHGSPLYNWHSIIREGLHYKETHHGRAYGHGVYMSPHASTSMGYTNMHYRSQVGWPNSELKVSTALSLNEVVNKPAAFVSQSPHYVVADIDWIQTRYLFVKTAASHGKGKQDSMEIVTQDPSRQAVGPSGQVVAIPLTAIPKSRRTYQTFPQKDSRKRKSLGAGRKEEPVDLIDDDNESIVTTNEDRQYLIDDESHRGHTPIVLDSDTEMLYEDDEFDAIGSPKKKLRHDGSVGASQLIGGALVNSDLTDFVPGTLDMSDIKVLPPPQDASLAATSQLMKAFKTLLKTQGTTPTHILGWYIDPEQVENVYQWILELHSFDKDIPLSQDMKKAGVISIVLEMRFTNQYPFAPPFVRVIKPRLLPFNQGGGGHVTEGGAICMELLTNTGWSAVSSIESVLLQIRLAMSEHERPARLPAHAKSYGRDAVYGVGEAIAAYERACRAHGWQVPPSFSTLQRGEAGPSR